MPISQVSLNQAMRPGEIAAINALNEVITLVNSLDLTGVNNRLTSLEARMTTAEGDISSNSGAITSNTGSITNLSADMTQVKATLYTPLNQNVPEPSSGN